MKKVLVINLGWEQEPLIKRLLQRTDCIFFGIHDNKKPYGIKNFKKIKTFDFRDLEGILKFAKEIIPDAVISDQCDYSLMAQALVAQKFNLPSPSIESAQLSNNKYLQRIKAQENGIIVMSQDQIPLFPLRTILYPDSRLPLRIFEPRYLDMISRCMREDIEFGIVLSRESIDPKMFES